jgi:predicted ribosome quality control (RQC) complex YloA/Tae2 family protein
VSQDTLALAAVRDELESLLVGGRVQRVIRPTELSIGLEIYAGQRHQVLLSAEAQAPRIALTDERLRRGAETASPLQLLLRKYVRGARLVAIEQPELERVLRWRFAGPEGVVDLVCEVMGRLSNLVLVDADGAILDAAKRIPAHINRYRVILPGAPYVPPPPQAKAHPLHISPDELGAALAQSRGPLERRLVNAVLGLSPLAAREVVYRALGGMAPEEPLADDALARLHGVLQSLMALPQTHAWKPSIGYQVQAGQRTAVAYAPYALTHLDAWEPVASISQAAALSLGTLRPPDPYAQARADLLALIEAQLERQRARLTSLAQAAVAPDELETLQFRGNAILTLAWSIAPGQPSLTATRAQVTGEAGPGADAPVVIPLNPDLSPSENAQAVFREYRKRVAAAEQVPVRMAEVEAEVAYLEQLRTDAELAEDRPALDYVGVALQEAGYIPRQGRRRSAPAGEPLRIVAEDGATILVGRNSRQNDEVTFRLSAPNDLWLHVRGAPGAHVIVRSGGQPVSEETLAQAAGLAAAYSALRREGQVRVDITERRHVKRIPGGRPGMVTYRQERTLLATPVSSDLSED